MDPARLPRLPGLPAFTDGQLEAIKWLALAAMVLDHVGRLWLGHGTRGAVFAGGRLAFPLFALALGLNLARSGDRAARCGRATRRLAVWCAVSLVPSVLARGHPALVNVLGTLGLGAALCGVLAAYPARLGAAGALAASLAVLVAAPGVEFGMPGVLLVPLVFALAIHPRPSGLLVLLLGLALVGAGNARAGGPLAWVGTLAALPAAWLVGRLPLRVPRVGWLFYGFYPLHLAVIGLWRPQPVAL